MNRRLIAALTIAGIVASASVTHATNITISDNNSGSITFGTLKTETSSGWFKGTQGGFVGTGPQSEYQEVEPGMQTGTEWDLAAFVEPAYAQLGVLSGYNLATGGTTGTTLGDIFVSINHTPTFLADPNTTYPHYTQNSTFGFDFAIHLDFGTNTYSVIQLTPTTAIENGEYFSANPLLAYNAASQPWRVVPLPTGGYSGVIATGAMTYTNALPVATAQALSGLPVTSAYKYYAQVDTSWLGSAPGVHPNDSVLYKLTMTCGNDNLLGLTYVPDNAATLSLLGLGLLALGSLAKWRTRKA